MAKKTTVLVVDDSALIRRILQDILNADPEIEVVGTAADPYFARDKIKSLSPDVVTLDVEMPRMDGISFLKNLMRLRPTPVVMISTLTEKGAEVTLEALEIGAVDFVAKPKVEEGRGLSDYAEEICAKVKAAAGSQPKSRPRTEAPKRLKRSGGGSSIIAIGSSTGGTEALKTILEVMPPDAPPIVIAQHIPEAFSGPFAARMNRASAMEVCEAQDGQKIMPGHAYIAPGDYHLSVVKRGSSLYTALDQSDPVNRHRPSVDVLFNSVADACGENVTAAILTGMGADGARGLLELHDIGAHTIAQDEASSVVWGMPGSAVKLGAAIEVLPLTKIASALLEAASRVQR